MKNNHEEQLLEGELVGLDIGEKNIGVARINTFAKISEPLSKILAGQDSFKDVLRLVKDIDAKAIIIGLPRGLDGQETAQTIISRDFASQLSEKTEIPIYLIDEAGTTKEAEKRILANPNASIDSLSATVFLEDFVNSDNKSLMRFR